MRKSASLALFARCLCLAGVVLALAACAGTNRGVKVVDPSPSQKYEYRVKSGDTMYSIAWRHEMHFVELARINNIPHPYTIYPGQTLKVTRPEAVRTAPAKRPQQTVAREKKPSPPAAKKAPAPATRPPTTSTRRATAGWHWPSNGKISKGFGRNNKGVDFTLQAGSEVRAAGKGTVIYSGSGLGGYSRLIIIRHDDRYMSAYSLDLGVLVKEGQSVRLGEVIARTTGEPSRDLHFEVRDKGTPIDPMRVLRGR